MASIHVQKAIAKAKSLGGYAGTDAAEPFWNLSKRELVEVAMRLGALVADYYSPEGGAMAVENEIDALRQNGII